MRNEQTSAAIATLAGRAMRSPETLTLEDIRRLGASALTQAADRRPLWKRLLLPRPES